MVECNTHIFDSILDELKDLCDHIHMSILWSSFYQYLVVLINRQLNNDPWWDIFFLHDFQQI